MCRDSVFEKAHACDAPDCHPPPPGVMCRESESTSEEEALDALRVAAQLYCLGQHSDGGPVVP